MSMVAVVSNAGPGIHSIAASEKRALAHICMSFFMVKWLTFIAMNL